MMEEYKQKPTDKPADVAAGLFGQSRLSIYSARFSDTKSRTQNNLLMVALALRAYKMEHEKYPAALTELAPEYLEQIPNDPFSLKKAFPYSLQGEQYSLYSIGPDGEDNGGAPVADAKTTNEQYDSKGDIVGGVNLR